MNPSLNLRFQRRPESSGSSEEVPTTALPANLEEEDSQDALKSGEKPLLVDPESSESSEEDFKSADFSEEEPSPLRDAHGLEL